MGKVVNFPYHKLKGRIIWDEWAEIQERWLKIEADLRDILEMQRKWRDSEKIKCD
jgi:thymidylate synthase